MKSKEKLCKRSLVNQTIPEIPQINHYMLVDFGSTYTKISLVDVLQETVLDTSQAHTTIQEGINIGLNEALKRLNSHWFSVIDRWKSLATSSAAGGLRMVVIGLVPELTVEAAKRVSLGAGAIVVGTFSFEITEKDVREIENLEPDIVLLSGGTDGGDKKTILHNAKRLSCSDLNVPIIVAGNRTVSEKVYEEISKSGKNVQVTSNVMPKLDKLEVYEVRKIIREVFVKHIIKAKGLQEAENMLDGVVLPTPEAVLSAVSLLSQGNDEEEGIGDVIVIDVGGATTDVYSISAGDPTQPGVLLKGLPEPFAKRTVEGDLGIRYNAKNILDQAGIKYFVNETCLSEKYITERIQQISQNVKLVSEKDEEKCIDRALAKYAVKVAMERHAGFIKHVYTPNGDVMVQYGKDLTEVTKIIGCGGIFCHMGNEREILAAALFDQETPWCLKPRRAEYYVDKKYILAHMGLLALDYPTEAIRIMKKYLLKV